MHAFVVAERLLHACSEQHPRQGGSSRLCIDPAQTNRFRDRHLQSRAMAISCLIDCTI